MPKAGDCNLGPLALYGFAGWASGDVRIPRIHAIVPNALCFPVRFHGHEQGVLWLTAGECLQTASWEEGPWRLEVGRGVVGSPGGCGSSLLSNPAQPAAKLGDKRILQLYPMCISQNVQDSEKDVVTSQRLAPGLAHSRSSSLLFE